MNRPYQHNFSSINNSMFEHDGRQKKARTMIAVLKDYRQADLSDLLLLNIGGSAGIIDDYLSRYLKSVTSIDIDEAAIHYAAKNFSRDNLHFEIGDAMQLHFDDNTFDVVVSSQVYEHVPDAKRMMAEIHRVLKPGGVCYFAAGNRLMLNEPHYNLPLLSVVPRPLAHIYMRLSGKGKFYYEQHLSFWGLKKLVNRYKVIDYTRKIIEDPEKFHADYMIPPNSRKASIAAFTAKYLFWLVPGYIWILEKTA